MDSVFLIAALGLGRGLGRLPASRSSKPVAAYAIIAIVLVATMPLESSDLALALAGALALTMHTEVGGTLKVRVPRMLLQAQAALHQERAGRGDGANPHATASADADTGATGVAEIASIAALEF